MGRAPLPSVRDFNGVTPFAGHHLYAPGMAHTCLCSVCPRENIHLSFSFNSRGSRFKRRLATGHSHTEIKVHEHLLWSLLETERRDRKWICHQWSSGGIARAHGILVIWLVVFFSFPPQWLKSLPSLVLASVLREEG